MRNSRPSPAESGTKGVQAAKGGHVDLVIMDVAFLTSTAARRCGSLRKTVQGADHHADRPRHRSDTILGLESGANDYVAKPFRFAALLARIRAQLRQHEASEDAIFTIGPLHVPAQLQAADGPQGQKIRLTEKETAILRFLYRAGLRPISREVLLQEVWGYNSGVTTHTLETHIYRLRQKIEKTPPPRRFW
jgi:DNA-binding response OmpR family regulator